MENELNALYRNIAETVNEMIPEPWEKFLFYAQISETGGGTYFFYNSPNEPNHFKYSLKFRLNLKMNSISMRWNYLN